MSARHVALLVLVLDPPSARADGMFEIGGGGGLTKFSGNRFVTNPRPETATGASFSASIAAGHWPIPEAAVGIRVGVTGHLLESAGAGLLQLGVTLIAKPMPAFWVAAGASLIPYHGASFSFDARFGVAITKSVSFALVPQLFYTRHGVSPVVVPDVYNRYFSLTGEVVYRR